MSKPEWTFRELSDAMLSMMGRDPSAGPAPGATPRTMSEITNDMVDSAGTSRLRLFVLSDTDMEALLNLQSVCQWLKADRAAQASFRQWRSGGRK